MKLSPKDATTLANWILGGATLNGVMLCSRIGLVENERFSERARDRFVYYWTWSTDRLDGRAGDLQQRMFDRGGYAALLRRFERVRRVINARTGRKV